MKKDNLKKNFIWNSIGSTVNAMTSLLYMIVVTRINGIEVAGAFTFAFSLAILFQVIGYYAGRVYQVTDVDKNVSDSDYIVSRLITSSLMIVLGIIYSLIKGYGFDKFIIIFILLLFRAVEVIADVIYGVFQKQDNLYKAGISLFLKGMLCFIFFTIVDLITKDIMLSILAILVLQIIILIFYDIRNLIKSDFKLESPKKESLISIFKIGLYTFLLALFTQYLINAPKYAIDNYLSDSYQTIYGIIAMPATFLVLCSQFILHPYLMKMTNFINKKEYTALFKLVRKLLLALGLIGVISLVVAYLIGIPFLELIYGIKLNAYLISLLVIIFGATLYGLATILSSVLVAFRKIKMQALVFFVDSILAYFLSNYLVKNNMVIGGSITYMISMSILFISFLIIYYIKKKAVK